MGAQVRRIPYGGGRAAIIAAAIELVAREGLPKLTFRALAAEAGLSLGAVRHSFATIDDVLRGAFEDSLESSLEVIGEATDLVDLFTLMQESVEKNPARSSFEIKVMTEAHHRPAIADLAAQYYQGFETFVRQFLEEYHLPADDDIVKFIVAMADGMNYQRVVFTESGAGRMRKQIRGFQRMMGLSKPMS